MIFHTDPQTAIEVDRIAKALIELPIGSTLTYEAIHKALGHKNHQLPLMRARKRAERESGNLYATVVKVGIKRLPAEEVAGVGASTRARIGKAAKRGFERLTLVKYNSLTKEDRARIDAERSLLGAVSEIAKDKHVQKVSTGTQTGPVPAAQVWEAITGTGN